MDLNFLQFSQIGKTKLQLRISSSSTLELGRVKSSHPSRISVLIPPSLEKQINTMDTEHHQSKLLASKRIHPKSANQPNSKTLSLNPTHLYPYYSVLFLCLPMPCASPSFIPIATHNFHLTFLEKSIRCRSHQ